MTTPRVSILIPAYNRAELLRLTLESALRQTIDDYEIVVVDDGSTDDTAAVVRSIAPSARYIYQDNQGIPEVLNRCVRETRGEYVQFLGSDDLLLPDTLARSAAVLDSHPRVALVHGAATIIDGAGKERYISRPPFVKGDYVRSGREEIGDLLFSNHIVATTVMARRSCLIEAGLFDARLKLYEDWNLWTRIARRHDIAYLDQPLACYRVHFGPTGSVFAGASAREIDRYRRMHLNEVLRDEEFRGLRRRAMARHHMVVARRACESNEFWYARAESVRAAAHPAAAPAAIALFARTFAPSGLVRRWRASHEQPPTDTDVTAAVASGVSE